MGVAILVNDLPSELFDSGFFIGHLDPDPTTDGKSHATKVAKLIHQKVEHLTEITASDAKRVARTVHQIRVHSPSRMLLDKRVKYTPCLRERSFGVLDGTLMLSVGSDLFRHSRVTGEDGESVSQCRDRVMGYIDSCVHPRWRGVIVSHPFVCQIASNVILGKSHTMLTSFWLSPGSFVVFDLKEGHHKTQWGFNRGYNAILGREYTEEQVYSDVLGEQGNNAS